MAGIKFILDVQALLAFFYVLCNVPSSAELELPSETGSTEKRK